MWRDLKLAAVVGNEARIVVAAEGSGLKNIDGSRKYSRLIDESSPCSLLYVHNLVE